MKLRSGLAVALVVAICASGVLTAGPAQDVLGDLARAERSTRMASGYTSIGLGVAIGVGSAVVLAGTGLELYGILTGALIAGPGIVSLVVPSAAEREFAAAGDSEAEAALALERLAEIGRRERVIAGIAHAAAGLAALLYPFEFFTPYDYVYSA